MLVVFLYTLARYTGLLRSDLPFVRRITRPLDESLILRALAGSVDAGKPLNTALWQLAKTYPKFYIRRKLWRAATRTNEGMQWCDSLQAGGLLTAGPMPAC